MSPLPASGRGLMVSHCRARCREEDRAVPGRSGSTAHFSPASSPLVRTLLQPTPILKRENDMGIISRFGTTRFAVAFGDGTPVSAEGDRGTSRLDTDSVRLSKPFTGRSATRTDCSVCLVREYVAVRATIESGITLQLTNLSIGLLTIQLRELLLPRAISSPGYQRNILRNQSGNGDVQHSRWNWLMPVMWIYGHTGGFFSQHESDTTAVEAVSMRIFPTTGGQVLGSF